jgi:hypothetical protein
MHAVRINASRGSLFIKDETAQKGKRCAIYLKAKTFYKALIINLKPAF